MKLGNEKLGNTKREWGAAMVTAGALLLGGCHHPQQVAYQPPPPAVSGHGWHRETPREARKQNSGDSSTASRNNSAGVDLKEEQADAPQGFFDDTHGKPVFTETGMASWYGPNYQHHAAADGTTYEQDGMTAAQRTLPLGSTVRVTNLATGQQVLVRITDRGPFSPGRVLDLSMGAAKAIGVYRAGVARVKVEAWAHATADPAGRWCVQTGAFKDKGDAMDLKNALMQRYSGARVMEFEGPTGFWVRIDPAAHGRDEAAKIADWIGTPGPAALPYLVRLD